MTSVKEKRLSAILYSVLAVLVLLAVYLCVISVKLTKGEYVNAIWEKPRALVLSSVPRDLRGSYYLQQKDKGDCRTLTGNIAVAVVQISDDAGQWDETSTAELKEALAAETQDIIAEAASHSVEVSIEFHYYNATLTGDICKGDLTHEWQTPALKQAGLPALRKVNRYLKKEYSADNALVAFALNKQGRSLATQGNHEYLVLFAQKDSLSFQHELSHVFGAVDFYFPEEVKTIAETHLAESVMNSGDIVDPLTAYLIGWTDTVDDSACRFLQETIGFSREYIKEEQKKQEITGYGTREFETGVYTGEMLCGECHGPGTMQYHNGGWYTGQWDYGRMIGYGTGKHIYKSGDIYEGEFLDGKRHGTGKIVYASGDVYEGEFAQNKRHGTGAVQYTDGRSYTGEWKDGQISGTGKFVYASGATYEGEFLEGLRDGTGTYYYVSGAVYTGQWTKDKINGIGIMQYSDGGWYSGPWTNGEKTGQGKAKMVQSSGVYEGEVLEGKQHGQGTYVWTNGETYEGQWTEGKITGYGTVTKPDGSVTTGYWLDGVFQY